MNTANGLSLYRIFCCNAYLQFETQDSAPSVQTTGVNKGAVSDDVFFFFFFFFFLFFFFFFFFFGFFFFFLFFFFVVI